MKKIILLCAGGMSTGVLVNNMKAVARQKSEEYFIDAFPINAVETVCQDADCVLLGPQVSYQLAEITSAVSCPVESIDMRYYGMMDGAKVLDQALAMIGG